MRSECFALTTWLHAPVAMFNRFSQCFDGRLHADLLVLRLVRRTALLVRIR